MLVELKMIEVRNKALFSYNARMRVTQSGVAHVTWYIWYC